MNGPSSPPGLEVTARARQSRGTSEAAIYSMAATALARRHPGGGTLLDVGCGTGKLWSYLGDRFDCYLGVDVVPYEDFPPEGQFYQANLENTRLPLADGTAQVVAAIETIEHLENPRAFLRELVRVLRPGGWIVVSTPNQLSLLSKMCLVLKNQFAAFQEAPGLYPAHLTALLEMDLLRMATECGLTNSSIAYSQQGRVPGAPWHYPRLLSRLLPRALSDNVLLLARKPEGPRPATDTQGELDNPT